MTQAIQRALVDSPADVKLMDEARRFDQRVLAVLRQLRGDETIVAEGAFLLKSDVLRSKMGAGCAD